MIFARPNPTLFASALLLALAACGDNPHLSFELVDCNLACAPGYVCESVVGEPVCVPDGKEGDGGVVDASREADAATAVDASTLDASPGDAAVADAAVVDATISMDATIADAAVADASAMDATTAADAAADSGSAVDCEDDIHAWSNADLDPYRHCTVIGSLTIIDDGVRPLTIDDVRMPSLAQVRRDVVIASTTDVTEINWPLTVKTGKVAILGNEGLTEISFGELTSTDLFFITDNASLDTIGLPKLDSATLLHVQNNPLIESLGAPLLRSASIKVHDSPALTNVTFPALQIAGFVWITSGPRSNLDLLRTIDLRLLRTVTFERSPSASDYIFPEVDPAVGVHNVYGSAGVSYGEGAAALWFMQLPALESIRLDALELVENTLSLDQTGEATAAAFSLEASALEHVGNISIASNAHVESIDFSKLIDVRPNALSTIRSSLLIEGNERLVSVALDDLVHVSEEIAYSRNGGPTTPEVTLEAPSLEWVRRLVISANPSLRAASFPELEQIGDISPTVSGLLVQNNAKLLSLDFSALTHASYGDIGFLDNPSLVAIDLNALTSFIYGSFYVSRNDVLERLDIANLSMTSTFASYVLRVDDNPVLCDIRVYYAWGSWPGSWTIMGSCP